MLVKNVRVVLLTSKSGIWSLKIAEVGERIFGGIAVVLACANRIVKMEERLLLC